jgi:N-acetylglucosamine transport system permease protein
MFSRQIGKNITPASNSRGGKSMVSASERSRRRFIFFFSVPALAFYFFFRFLPSVMGFAISLFNWKGVSLNMKFIGLDNYTRLFNDRIFYKALGNHLYIYLFNTAIVFIFAVALAVLITNSKLKERNFYRIMLFFPSVVPAVIVNVLWISIFNPNIGILNSLLGVFGIAGKNWLGDAAIVKNSILTVMVWYSLGFYMVLFMAAVLNIPSDLFEASRIDGAGTVRQTFSITIPLIWEQIRTALVFFIVTSCGVGFNVVFMLTRGGPSKASEILPSYMYLLSFGGQSKFGYAMSVAVMIMLITTFLALLLLKVTKRESYEI